MHLDLRKQRLTIFGTQTLLLPQSPWTWLLFLLALAVVATLLMGSFGHLLRAILRSKTGSGTLPHNTFMNCGDVTLCGVLTLQTGYGRGVYRHREPTVHGLWPQTDHFGTSQCVRSKRAIGSRRVRSCYDQPGRSSSENLAFQQHEWSKHGSCAGAVDEEDYLGQVCTLAAPPLRLMSVARAKGADLGGIVASLQDAGFPIWNVREKTGEIELSACAEANGQWLLLSQQDFASRCGSVTAKGHRASTKRLRKPPRSDEEEIHGARASAGKCLSGRHGPACTADADCSGLQGCARCAHSGFCTDVP